MSSYQATVKFSSPKVTKKYVELDPIVARKWVQPKRCETQHNSLCEICQKFFPNQTGSKLFCVYCNVVCHTQCMLEFHKKLVPSKEWICFYCIDFLDESKSTHEQKQRDNENFGLHTEAQITIAKYWRRYVDRRFYIKIYNLIVYLQVRFRVNKRKEAFHKQVQSKLRPFNLRIIKCSNLNLDAADKRVQKRRGSLDSSADDYNSGGGVETDSVYVIVTVLDITKGQLHQTWRLTSDLVPLDAAHFAPHGATTAAHPHPAHHPHLHTQNHHHHHHSHKHLYMDCNFLLGGVSGYNYVVLSLYQRGTFSRDILLGQAYLDLSLGMAWKRGGVFTKPLEEQDFAVKDHLGMDLKTDFRPRPQGTIEFELQPVQGLCSGCGVVHGPAAEDLVRIVSLQARFSGFSVPVPTGGSLERRKYTVGLSNSSYGSGSTALPAKKSWIAIADGRIYMYSHFGDSLKIKINVEHFSFFAMVRNKNVVYVLRAPDFPDLEFYTSNKEEELRWKCAFLSTFRFKRSGTMVVSGGDTYDMRGLVKDLSMLEVGRYGNKDSPLLHFYSPTTSIGASSSSKHSSVKTAVAAAAAAVVVVPVGSPSAGSKVREEDAKKKVIPSQPSSLPPANLTIPLNSHSALNVKSTASPVTPGAVSKEVLENKSDIKRLSSVGEIPSASSLQTMASSSSMASSSTDGDGGDVGSLSAGPVDATSPGGLRRKPTSNNNNNNSKKGVLGSSLVSLSGKHYSKDDAAVVAAKKVQKNVFDEIDREIANIQEVKAKYSQEAKETKEARHHKHKHERHKRVAVEGGGISGSSSSSSSGGISLNSSRCSTSRDLTPSIPKAVSILQIKEAVSDIYEAEEGVLNDKVSSVGAKFVTNILSAIKQRKVLHHNSHS